MLNIIRPGTKFDFVKYQKPWAGVSLFAVIASIVLVSVKGLNYGIDFEGGLEIQVKVPEGMQISSLRDQLTKAGVEGAAVITMGESHAREFLIKAQGDSKSLNEVSAKVETALSADGSKGFEILKSDIVGPAAGDSLKKAGLLSFLYAVLLILIYIFVRFDFYYSMGAILAVVHDSIVVVGMLVLTGYEFDLKVLAALLALIGYSINDTIVTFDRIREVIENHPKMTIGQVVNKAINETLSRTILTSLTTFFSAFALWFWGGAVIHGFAFTFMTGVVVGTYSSVFVASTILIFMTNNKKKRNTAAKQGGMSHATPGV